MVSLAAFRKLALSYPEAREEPHFQKLSFRVGRKIFATYDPALHQACLKLSELQQDLFSAFDREVIFPVPNQWGKQGWTFVNLKKVRLATFQDALTEAYRAVAPKKLAALLPSG